jgi:hypothetical protein
LTVTLSRAQLVSRGFKTGAALIAAGSATELLTGTACADTIPDDDLAYARLLVAAELLGADFYARAIASKRFDARAQACLKRARFNEREHNESVAGILSGAGQTPAAVTDFDFSYPKGSFASRTGIAKLGVTLETVFSARISVRSARCRRMRSSSPSRVSRQARPSTWAFSPTWRAARRSGSRSPKRSRSRRRRMHSMRTPAKEG